MTTWDVGPPQRRTGLIMIACGAAAALAAGAIGIGIWGGAVPKPHGGHAVHASAAAAPADVAGRPATVVTPLSCEKLPNVPGKSITTALVGFPPNAYSPRHRHPGSVMAFVVKGTIRSQLEGGPVGTFGAGQTWFEPPGTIHLFAENASATEPAELLAIFVADDDCGPLVIRD